MSKGHSRILYEGDIGLGYGKVRSLKGDKKGWVRVT